MASTVRISITVPKDLKARMDEVDEPINWSAVASRAFEQTLADIISRKGVKQMEDVITRLRASKQKHANEQFNSGFEKGKLWAGQTAEAEELMRLEAVGTERFADWFGEDSNNAYGPGERFVFLIQPENDGGRTAAQEFWEFSLGDDMEATWHDPEFVCGFAEGALHVWDEVKDKL